MRGAVGVSGAKRSIGEVLALLKQEFGDLTISKIRFLESQGLVDPERTPSGYRKFDDTDVARLRFILRQQKEHFLPLKVIKERLEQAFDNKTESPAGATSDSGEVGQSMRAEMIAGVPVSGTMSRSELLGETGLSESQLRELEQYGLVNGNRLADGIWYDECALVVAKIAARFLKNGTEVRHLRIFKTAADREADLYRQLVMPVRGMRNTQARMEAKARLDELTSLGEAMRAELLRSSLGE